MTLRPIDASGSQRFTSDGGIHTSDIRALTSPPGIIQPTEPLAVADYIKPVPIKGMPGLFYGKATIYDHRGPVRQRGEFREAHFSRSNGSLQGDKPGFIRLPNRTDTQTTPDPSTTPTRMVKAYFKGVDVMAFTNTGSNMLYRTTSATDPTIIEVAGFTSHGATIITDLTVASFSGVSYLLISYANKGAATSTVQALADLNNPPTDSFMATGFAPVWGCRQLPDGTLVMNYSGRITMIATDAVTPATAVVNDFRAHVEQGGYFVAPGDGLISLGGGQPLLYLVTQRELVSGNGLVFDSTVANSLQGKLIAVSLDGWIVQSVNTGLPWVTFATKVRDGIMDCDQHTHGFDNGRRLQTMNWLEDRAPSSEAVIYCRGHYTDGQRFWWHPNFVTPGGTTIAWWEEYDFDLNVSLPVSSQTSYTTVGAQSVGGWDLPYFPETRYITDYADGAWHRQKQPPLGVLGYNQVKTGGSATGDDFEATEFSTWPVMHYPGFEGCPHVTVSIEGPSNGAIAHGHAAVGAGTTDAYVEWAELLSGVRARFHQRGPTDRRNKKSFPLNRSWGNGFQPQCILGRQTGGTDPSKYTPNGAPVTYEMILYKDGLQNIVPAQYRNLDASAVLRGLGR